MFSTYNSEDVTILLKDISGMITPLDSSTREKEIQRGIHYSEMLPIEYEPSEEYVRAYNKALCLYSDITADAVATVSEKIFKNKGKNVVLVSLARAGTSIGVLIKRYILFKYNICVPHYTISIIKGKGIDINAINYLISCYKPQDIQFIDGWTGKGTIYRELQRNLIKFNGISGKLAVLSDPAYITDMCGTHNDFLIPSSCLNSTVSGLLSRTVMRQDIINDCDYHGCVFYKKLMDKDETYNFINKISSKFVSSKIINENSQNNVKIKAEIDEIMNKFNIKDINFIKPGIGETTRVLLRRLPWKILVNDFNNENLKLIYILAKEKNIEIEKYPLKSYSAVGIIKSLKEI